MVLAMRSDFAELGNVPVLETDVEATIPRITATRSVNRNTRRFFVKRTMIFEDSGRFSMASLKKSLTIYGSLGWTVTHRSRTKVYEEYNNEKNPTARRISSAIRTPNVSPTESTDIRMARKTNAVKRTMFA